METNRMKVVNVPLDEITPYENNPRVNEGAVEQLAKIIEQFGFRNPAVLNKDTTPASTRVRSSSSPRSSSSSAFGTPPSSTRTR